MTARDDNSAWRPQVHCGTPQRMFSRGMLLMMMVGLVGVGCTKAKTPAELTATFSSNNVLLNPLFQRGLTPWTVEPQTIQIDPVTERLKVPPHGSLNQKITLQKNQPLRVEVVLSAVQARKHEGLIWWDLMSGTPDPGTTYDAPEQERQVPVADLAFSDTNARAYAWDLSSGATVPASGNVFFRFFNDTDGDLYLYGLKLAAGSAPAPTAAR